MSSESPTISVHDNVVISYSVDSEKRQITFHTVYYHSEQHEYTDVIFSEVVAYHFEGDTLRTIILDIDESDIAYIYRENEALFLRQKNYVWPTSAWRYDTPEQLVENLKASGIKGFTITSSIGLDGFVLAKEMRFVSRTL